MTHQRQYTLKFSAEERWLILKHVKPTYDGGDGDNFRMIYLRFNGDSTFTELELNGLFRDWKQKQPDDGSYQKVYSAVLAAAKREGWTEPRQSEQPSLLG